MKSTRIDEPGSEIAGGADEAPDVAWSMPIGAARLARSFFAAGTPTEDDVRRLRHDIRVEIARDAGKLLRAGAPDRAVATSKTFKQLARIAGAAPSDEGERVPRYLSLEDLDDWVPKLAKMTYAERAELPGVSEERAPQLLAGAVVAEAVLSLLDVEQVQICPWALREGVILRRLDWMRGEP